MNDKRCNENPLRQAGCINKLFFWWLKDILGRSRKIDLKSDDIYDTMPEDLSKPLQYTLEIAWQKEMDKAKSKSMKPSLLRVLVSTYCSTFLKLATFQTLYVIAFMMQPQLFEMIMLYFDSTSTTTTLEAYTYATLVIVLMAFQTSMLRYGAFQMNRLGMQIKVACSSLIYKKITKLSCSSTSGSKSASAISLLSTDVGRFELLLLFLVFLVILPIQLAGVTYLIYLYVGFISAISGIALMIFQNIPLQMLTFNLMLKWRAKQVINTDTRISLIDETVAGVRAIKMHTWEKHFEKLICHARRLEIQGHLKISYLLSASDYFIMVSHRICLFAVTLIYFLRYNVIKMANVLSVRQLVFNLRDNLSVYGFLAMQAVANVRVSIQRIENFLLLPEVQSNVKKTQDRESFGTISIKNVKASWNERIKEDCTFHTITIDFLPRMTYAILGATGSGKSSLLKLMLGELETISGQVSVGGEISYASQEPWLFAASIRENILFGEAYEDERYNEVVKACSLLDDFNNLPYGDKTLVGDRGMSLSGGQRARINIARAVYRKADIYLLDDPFSAVDTRVAKTLRSQCVSGLLKDKTVIFVTYNLHYLSKDDQVILLNSGEIHFEGSLLDFQKNKESMLFLPPDESELIESIVHFDNSDTLMPKVSKNVESRAPNENNETISRGTLSMSVCVEYVKAGGYVALLIVLMAHLFPTVLMFKFDSEMIAWIQEKSDNASNQKPGLIDTLNEYSLHSNTMIVLGSILILILCTSMMKNVLIYRFIFIANQNLHKNMFANVIRTSLRFFEMNPSGRVLNRFSEDMGNMDNVMPESLVDLFKMAFFISGSLVFVVIINWWNLVPIVLTCFIFVWVSCIYVATVPKFKRLAASAKSPVLTFVTSTLAGLTTIRVCKAENLIMREFASRLDKHTAVFFLAIASAKALAFWIDMLAIGLFACTAYICIASKNNGILAGQAVLTLTTMYEIVTDVSYTVRVFADMCAHIINVERVLQYTELEPEDSVSKELIDQLPESWPTDGEIKFKRVSLRYPGEDRPVLNDLNFTIEPGTKIGIVGRTGAGKSSLITALFRLAKLDGRLSIDNVDTQKIDLSRLRSKISIIPQEPVLFSASLRSNLDPLNEFDDATLWSALDSVGLKQTFSSLEQLIEKGGKNLSLGQRQMLCLARAVPKNNKILVLDEATANVDSATDALIQKTIRDKFKSCTVLTIAHRLNTIMDSDKVLVMDHGRVVEYGHPHELLQNPHGNFTKMVKQTGEKISKQLKAKVKTAYNNLAVQSTYL